MVCDWGNLSVATSALTLCNKMAALDAGRSLDKYGMLLDVYRRCQNDILVIPTEITHSAIGVTIT